MRPRCMLAMLFTSIAFTDTCSLAPLAVHVRAVPTKQSQGEGLITSCASGFLTSLAFCSAFFSCRSLLRFAFCDRRSLAGVLELALELFSLHEESLLSLVLEVCFFRLRSNVAGFLVGRWPVLTCCRSGLVTQRIFLRFLDGRMHLV